VLTPVLKSCSRPGSQSSGAAGLCGHGTSPTRHGTVVAMRHCDDLRGARNGSRRSTSWAASCRRMAAAPCRRFSVSPGYIKAHSDDAMKPYVGSARGRAWHLQRPPYGDAECMANPDNAGAGAADYLGSSASAHSAICGAVCGGRAGEACRRRRRRMKAKLVTGRSSWSACCRNGKRILRASSGAASTMELRAERSRHDRCCQCGQSIRAAHRTRSRERLPLPHVQKASGGR